MDGETVEAQTAVRALDQLKPDPQSRVFDAPRTVLLALDAGEGIAPHRHPDATVVIHVLDGAMEIALDGTPQIVEAGELIRFDGSREVAPEALETARAVVQLHDDSTEGDDGP